MLAHWPPGRRIAVSALFCVAVAVAIATATRGMAASAPVRLLQGAAIAVCAIVVLGLLLAAITARLADYREPADEEEFERLVRRSEELARVDAETGGAGFDADEADGSLAERDPYDPADFDALVREALDDLPDLLLRALRHVAVVISDDGRRHRAYGLYQGDGVARDGTHDRIVIFRDTLLRDFGHDPDELRAQVTRTVRHELAHHLGADELGVRELGL
jgi:predicted Zn-dependent protease with MMP-like domain